jgi:hypothetical protein
MHRVVVVRDVLDMDVQNDFREDNIDSKIVICNQVMGM